MATNTAAYSSFSGIDIIAVIGDVVVGTLQGISYSVTREKAPIYTFGSANARSFSRGKRGLAGSMIFTLFDRSALYQVMSTLDYYYYAHEGEEYTLNSNTNVWDWAKDLTDKIQAAGGSIHTNARPAEYADQIMPFNITLIAQNEYGLAAWMAILGIEILNEGGGLSVDDITNEEQMTYVARSKTAWVPWVPSEDVGEGGFLPRTDDDGNIIGSNTAGETYVRPFEQSTLDKYKSWLGLTE